MATIGNFTKTETGYAGEIRTLGFTCKANINKIENPSESGPDFRVMAGLVEIGAAWKRTAKSGRHYISVKLDDPSFPAPVYANLVEQDDEARLIWSR
jgi:uncharacterized protein (DUF736 family)